VKKKKKQIAFSMHRVLEKLFELPRREQQILDLLYEHKRPMSGSELTRATIDGTGGSVLKIGTVYTTLKRLLPGSGKGYVTVRYVKMRKEGGAPMPKYVLTEEGYILMQGRSAIIELLDKNIDAQTREQLSVLCGTDGGSNER
jgi:DNA-binding PadR family transcriptional regulator